MTSIFQRIFISKPGSIWRGLSERKVIINIFAGHPDRSLSQAQLSSLVGKLQEAYPDVQIILLDHRNEDPTPAARKGEH